MLGEVVVAGLLPVSGTSEGKAGASDPCPLSWKSTELQRTRPATLLIRSNQTEVSSPMYVSPFLTQTRFYLRKHAPGAVALIIIQHFDHMLKSAIAEPTSTPPTSASLPSSTVIQQVNFIHQGVPH